jgi:hypothetical protein
MSVDLGHGTTMAFGTSGWTVNIVGVGDVGWEREIVDSTHLGTSDWKTYLFSRLRDGGSPTMTVQHDPSNLPPSSTTAEEITITLYDTNTIVFDGAIASYKISIASEELTTAQVTLKVTGAVTGVNA